MLNPMYIIGISAFSTVYVKLFILSILLKTQVLKISIYSNRRNNYLYSNVHIKYKSISFKNCVNYRTVLYEEQFLVQYLLQTQQLLYLCHAYFIEMHPGTFLVNKTNVKH